ncbi:MAG TPA: alpha/beta hydrolase [Allosphingosinicella sp.]|nr:alpha/beta hydrolase [Allosphingosinicella sp.]
MKRKRLMWTLILLPVVVYFFILITLFLAQTSMLFPVGHIGPDTRLPAAAERLEIAAASGERLHGLHIPSDRRRGERLLILGFGGNAANASGTAAELHDLFPEADVVTFYYRGYPPSEGSPSAEALQEDSLRIHDIMIGRFRPDRTVAVGFSVGSGVAASLAGHRPLDGLILVTPFDSLGRVAASHYRWLPVRLLFRHDMEPAVNLRRSPTPVAIIAGGRDDLVPGPRTQALRLAVPILAFDRTIEDAGHNDIYGHPEFEEAMREALRRLLARPRQGP